MCVSCKTTHTHTLHLLWKEHTVQYLSSRTLEGDDDFLLHWANRNPLLHSLAGLRTESPFIIRGSSHAGTGCVCKGDGRRGMRGSGGDGHLPENGHYPGGEREGGREGGREGERGRERVRMRDGEGGERVRGALKDW